MANLRKLLFALAVVLVATITASAQAVPAFQCTANAAVPPTVRAEGLAELVGDLVLNCTGGTPTAAGKAVPRVNVQIFLNTNITSRWWDPAMEALLLIDDPDPSQQNPCDSLSGCPLTGNGTGLLYATGKTNNVYNVYQARYYSANSIVWLGVPLDPPGTTATRILRIKNVRANANQLGVSATLVPTQIMEYISVVGETSVPINNPQQVVGYVLTGLSVGLRACDGTSYGDMGWSSTGYPALQCNSINADTYGSSSETLDNNIQFRLRFSETFASSFKKRSVATDPAATGAAAEQSTPTGVNPATGLLYNTETGFYNPNFPSTNNLNIAGLATNGTRLRAVFTNVPAGVALYVSTTEVSATESNKGVLVTTDANGEGAYSPTAATNTSTITCPSGTWGFAPVALSGGTGVAVWEITDANALAAGRIDFGVAIAYKANTAANLPGVGMASVAMSFAPVSTLTTSNASKTSPLPRFADTGSAKAAFTINPCSTNLLFPFVTNQAGFDTGIAIANTSKDPFGTTTQSGSCKINYYGETAGGGAAPAAQTSGTVPAGGLLVFTLSSGGNLGITGTPGFQGYIIAQCNFQYAHGFAFISDLGSAKLAQGYLALVMDWPLGYRTKFASEALTQ